ncbi:MAG TPA: helix-turn-helix domain-containing protein [Ferruginibacter sp.]|nr:helix-turn-helix domain-containing protein [Ferruginibacter sp.]HRQ20516.1 helix-turn-helix domain-containing protein [Ferruginibacter sp.]
MITGKEIKLKLRAEGLRLEDVAATLGISRATLHNNLNREKLPVSFLENLLKHYGKILNANQVKNNPVDENALQESDYNELYELQSQLKQKDRIINTLLEQIEDLRKQNAGSGHKAKAI